MRVQGFNIFVSTLSLAAIGMDRVLLVLFPVRFRHESGLVTGTILGVVWVGAAALSWPYLLAVHALPVPGAPYNTQRFSNALRHCGFGEPRLCLEDQDTSLFSSRFYSLFCFLFQYFVPLLVLSATYWFLPTPHPHPHHSPPTHPQPPSAASAGRSCPNPRCPRAWSVRASIPPAIAEPSFSCLVWYRPLPSPLAHVQSCPGAEFRTVLAALEPLHDPCQFRHRQLFGNKRLPPVSPHW